MKFRYLVPYRLKDFDHLLSARFNRKVGVTQLKRSEPVVISLTTIPERLNRVAWCIDSLLRQNLKPDRIVLWLSEKNSQGAPFVDKKKIPRNLLSLQKRGLEIRWCDDVRSLTKILPALKKFPEALIVTADDDVFYPKDWLASLYNAYLSEPQYIHCHRAHLIKYAADGEPLPYSQWDILSMGYQGPSYDLLPTGVGGVLYAPGHLDEEVLNVQQYLELCPKADDLWLKAMSLKAGVLCKKINKLTLRFVKIKYFTNKTLSEDNVDGGENDIQLEAINMHYKVFKSDHGCRLT